MSFSNPTLDKLFSAPGLLRPGVKPKFGTAKQQLDSTMTGRWLFNENAGENAFDISNKYGPGDLTTGALLSADRLSFSGSFANRVALDKTVQISDNECTIIFRYRTTSSSVNDGIFGDKYLSNWVSTDGISINIRSDGGLLFLQGLNVAHTTTDLFNDFNFHDVICRYKSGELLEVYVDKVEIAYTSQDTGTSYVEGVAGNARIGTYYNGAIDRSAKGDLEYLTIKDEYMTVSQAFAIVDNPYSDLTPSNVIAFPSEVAPPPSFNPAWARNANPPIIGVGM